MKLDDYVSIMNNRLSANDNGFYFDYQDGEYGFNTSSERGADTFFPFKSGIDILTPSTYTRFGTNSSLTKLAEPIGNSLTFENGNMSTLICPPQDKIIRLYIVYTGAYGGFQIWYYKNNSYTNLGEKANQNIDIDNAQYLVVSGNIGHKVTYTVLS